jgi:hypothetical protein
VRQCLPAPQARTTPSGMGQQAHARGSKRMHATASACTRACATVRGHCVSDFLRVLGRCVVCGGRGYIGRIVADTRVSLRAGGIGSGMILAFRHSAAKT